MAERRWSAGYFASSISICLRILRITLSVNLPEYDVLRTDDGNDVGQHVAFCHFVHALQVGGFGCADFQAVGSVCAV